MRSKIDDGAHHCYCLDLVQRTPALLAEVEWGKNLLHLLQTQQLMK
ncbi:hypothetical protein [Holospora elegans]|nr:hypothetical protein [Holospora elegans]